MGMDVYGKQPKTTRGEYFRNNVWRWHPLWDYCTEVAPEICEDVCGHTNDGEGLDELDSIRLANILIEEIASGRVFAYEHDYNTRLASLPFSECPHCSGTGVRTDSVGVAAGMPMKELEPERAVYLARTHGWCNACHGEGKTPHFETNYKFSGENVFEFAQFLLECGGFSIC
jgi:hypothetical protein